MHLAVGVRLVGDRGSSGETEVEHARPAIIADHDVGGLEIAVDDAGIVCGREAAARADEHLHDIGHRSFADVEPLLDVVTFDELHRDVDPIIEHAGVIHGDHIGMREPRERLGLSQQPGARFGVLALAVANADELERDAAVELRVVRFVYDPHAAHSELVHDDVAPDRGGPLEKSRRFPRHLHGSVCGLGVHAGRRGAGGDVVTVGPRSAHALILHPACAGVAGCYHSEWDRAPPSSIVIISTPISSL